nr:TipAS antibiotic-recognition domain-containing protein [uncultured Roseateles sp.]
MPNSYAEELEQCRQALFEEQSQSLASTAQWSHVDKGQAHADWDALYQRLAPLVDRSPAQAEEVQTLMAQHYAIASRFFRPSKKAYIGMALFYAENTEMRNFHNRYHPNMVTFLREAMAAHAHQKL